MVSVNERVHLKDRNHHIFLANHSFRRKPADPSGDLRDLTRLSDYDLFAEEFADRSYALEEEVLAGKAVDHLMQETLDGDGKKQVLDHRKFPVRDSCEERSKTFPGEVIRWRHPELGLETNGHTDLDVFKKLHRLRDSFLENLRHYVRSL